ncbi:MAG: family 20 glycosylhydrolase [Chlorobi bacterium]|nr:family 20 glycosylhydrolase [Chlorobiota bacterium]
MKKTFELLIVISFVFSSCETHTPKDLLKENLIPKPSSVTATGSSFNLEDDTEIYFQKGNESVKKTAEYLAGILRPSTGFALETEEADRPEDDDAISLMLDESKKSLGDEGYELEIDEEYITLTAYKPAGLFRGVQTLRQLLPARIESKELQQGPWEIATGKITDKPAYGFRSAMLDVSRHFFSVDDVKKFIDRIAAFKINYLHLHLTDDQGWRIEIKSWPKLAEIGGSTQVGGGKGGYYTQEQYSDIVKYAADRFITIIPEIDMPGHTNAALASYGELNPDNKPKELYTGTDVGFSTLAIHKDVTYKFIDDVIREVAALTPGQYIHIGGDESHATKHDDYIFFIEKVQDIVNSHGKNVIGWADISTARLKPTTIAQFWKQNPDNALQAIEQGAKIIMSNASRMYMDLKYDSTTTIGLTWAGTIEVDKAYDWNPETMFEGITKKDLIGYEAPLWTETVKTLDDIDYLVFPRLAGYAEIGWSANDRNWNEYKKRLASFDKRFEYMGINYYRSPKVWEKK